MWLVASSSHAIVAVDNVVSRSIHPFSVRVEAHGPVLDHLALLLRPTPCYELIWVPWRERKGNICVIKASLNPHLALVLSVVVVTYRKRWAISLLSLLNVLILGTKLLFTHLG
jgi:hypothetical protein